MKVSANICLSILLGVVCYCGKKKGKGKSHCRSCYFALPPEMRNALYRRMREGYEEAYNASLEYLETVNA